MARQTSGYLQSDREIVEAIKRGLDDIAAGRTIPHEEAMRQIRKKIARFAITRSKQTPSSGGA
jgi:predicted transcriptional regulator